MLSCSPQTHPHARVNGQRPGPRCARETSGSSKPITAGPPCGGTLGHVLAVDFPQTSMWTGVDTGRVHFGQSTGAGSGFLDGGPKPVFPRVSEACMA